MKKLFNQLGQWVLKYKKRLIYGSLALFISQFCFFNLGGVGINNVAYAVEGNTPTQNGSFQEKATSWLQDLSFIQRAVYVLLYPILALAGILVNNSFVYAEVFNFDAVLWQLWNIVRNLANYALGFIFVFKIFRFLTHDQKSEDMKKLLTSTLIAGIGIQASWFLLAVLIDISNIVTYGIGGLPITTLGQQTDFANPYVFRTVIYADTETPDSVQFYLSTTNDNQKFISECKTFSFSYNSGSDKIYEELILAPRMLYYYDGSGYKGTEETACHIGEDVYYFQGLYKDGDNGIRWTNCSGTGCKNAQNDYNASLDNAIKFLQSDEGGLDRIKGLVEAAKVLEIGDAHSGRTDLKITYGSEKHFGLDVDNNRNGERLGLNRLNNILTGSYVGVFTSLYSSLLNAGTDLRVSEVTDPGVYTSLLNVLLSLCHTLAVGIPLIAMLVVFIMRIGVIWMAIVLSPAIVLVEAFGWRKQIESMDLLKYLTLSNLIGIIFSPAIICFAVSISAVLVRLISVVNVQGIMTTDADILKGLIKLNIAGLGVNIGKLVCSVIGVAISWFLIWSAIKASELGKSKLVTGLESLAKTAIGSVPIVPIPKKDGGIEFIGASTAFGGNGQEGIFSQISNGLKSKYERENNAAVNDWFKSGNKAEEESKINQLAAYKRKLLGLSVADIGNGDWRTRSIEIGERGKMGKTFGSFSGGEQEDIINAINNIGDENTRKAFGDSVSEVEIGGDTYTFVEKDGSGKDVYKYQKQGTS